MPKVSILMPTYNAASTITEAIDSILRQEYQDFEIIVIDDGSTDNTKDILARYAGKVRYFYQANAGACQARLFGLGQAAGEYIAVLDSDDIWLPDRLALEVPVLEDHPQVDFVFADFHDFSSSGFAAKTCFDNCKVFRKIPCRPLGEAYPHAEIFTRDILYDYLQGNFILQSTMLVRKSICLKFCMFTDNSAIREQYEFCLRSLHQMTTAFIDRVLVHRRIHARNMTRNVKLFHERTVHLCQKAMNYPWMDARCKKFLKTSIRRSSYLLGTYCLQNKDKVQAREFLRQACGGFGHWRARLLYLSTFM